MLSELHKWFKLIWQKNVITNHENMFLQCTNTFIMLCRSDIKCIIHLKTRFWKVTNISFSNPLGLPFPPWNRKRRYMREDEWENYDFDSTKNPIKVVYTNISSMRSSTTKHSSSEAEVSASALQHFTASNMWVVKHCEKVEGLLRIAL